MTFMRLSFLALVLTAPIISGGTIPDAKATSPVEVRGSSRIGLLTLTDFAVKIAG
jgi:hypothetical protein